MSDATDGRGFAGIVQLRSPIKKHQDEIHKRGFTEEQANKFTILADSTMLTRLLEPEHPYVENTSATLYPFYHINGSPMTFKNAYGEHQYAAVRFHPPFDKHHKYLSPRTDTRVYYPQVADWRDLPADEDVWFVEGEVKALVAMLHEPEGLHWCVGFAGHTRFVPGGKFPKDLDELDLYGRSVHIVMDYDNKEKTLQQVEASIRKVCTALHMRNATPYVARIQRTALGGVVELGEKMGLDDYLEHGGTWAELEKTLEFVPPDQPELLKLLEQYAFCRNPSGVVDLNTGFWAKKNDWKDYTANKLDKNERGKEVPANDNWLKHPSRQELDTFIFHPGLPPLSIVEWEGKLCYNTWRGFPDLGEIRNPEAVEVFQRFMRRRSPEYGEYLMDWIAHRLKFPGIHNNHGVVQKDVGGSGKSLLGIILTQMMGREHVFIGSMEDINGNYNDFLEHKLIAIIEEPSTDHGSKWSMTDKIKKLITEHTMNVHAKYVGMRQGVPCFQAWMFNSNRSAPLTIDSKNRKLMVIESLVDMEDAEHIADCAWLYQKFDPMSSGYDQSAVASLREWLMERTVLEEQFSGNVEQTDAADEMADLCMTDGQRAVEEWLDRAEGFDGFAFTADNVWNAIRASVEIQQTAVLRLVKEAVMRRGWVIESPRRKHGEWVQRIQNSTGKAGHWVSKRKVKWTEVSHKEQMFRRGEEMSKKTVLIQ